MDIFAGADIFFLLKRLVSGFLLPVPFCLVLMIFGYWQRQRRAWLGRTAFFVGAGLLAILSAAPVTNQITAQLEQAQTPWQAEGGVPEYIAVLGSGHASRPDLNSLQKLTPTARSRVVAAATIARRHPNMKVLTLGAKGLSMLRAHALVSREAFIELGIDQARVQALTDGWDTLEEARSVKDIVANKPVLLVTSATHMARALATFKAQGVNAIAAPGDFIGSKSSQLNFSAYNLYRSERVLHEWLGEIWYKLRGYL